MSQPRPVSGPKHEQRAQMTDAERRAYAEKRMKEIGRLVEEIGEKLTGPVDAVQLVAEQRR